MGSSEGNKRSWPGGRLNRLALVAVLLLLALALLGDKGILRAVRLSREKASLQEEVRRLEEANAALRREIEALRSDRKYLESLARQELGMVRDDELVYQFPPQEKTAGRKGE